MIETSKVKIRLEENAILIVFDKPTDAFRTSCQDATALMSAIYEAVAYLPRVVIVPASVNAELAAIQVKEHEGGVAMNFGWTDRVRLSRHAAKLLADRIKSAVRAGYKAQREKRVQV